MQRADVDELPSAHLKLRMRTRLCELVTQNLAHHRRNYIVAGRNRPDAMKARASVPLSDAAFDMDRLQLAFDRMGDSYVNEGATAAHLDIDHQQALAGSALAAFVLKHSQDVVFAILQGRRFTGLLRAERLSEQHEKTRSESQNSLCTVHSGHPQYRRSEINRTRLWSQP